jgi:phosphoribosylformimino-5-aminoimidazole carboxamide ribotide isomerase
VIVVPAIDVRGGRVVRLLRGDPARQTDYGDDPAAVARGFEAAGAGLIHVVDLDAALGSGSNREAIGEVCRSVHVAVQVGGGVRSMDALEAVLASGAAHAVLGTALLERPELLLEAVSRYRDRVVAAVDVLEGRVMVRGWGDAGRPVEEVLALVEETRPVRVLMTSIAVDGSLQGPDLELYRRALTLTSVPLLASGGVHDLDDVRALADVGVEGVIVGRAIYEGTLSLPEAIGAAG